MNYLKYAFAGTGAIACFYLFLKLAAQKARIGQLERVVDTSLMAPELAVADIPYRVDSSQRGFPEQSKERDISVKAEALSRFLYGSKKSMKS